MGLEAYLFNIQFEQPVREQDIVGLFAEIGMIHLKERHEEKTERLYGSYYFELRTEKGLTEAHCLLAPKDTLLTDFSLRFSVVSPQTVIDQTFDLLKHLHSLNPIRIYDAEIKNHMSRLWRRENQANGSEQAEKTEEKSSMEQMCYIQPDAALFKQNQLGIMKREIVLRNEKGKIIESGRPTIDHISKEGSFDRFLGWIVNEL